MKHKMDNPGPPRFKQGANETAAKSYATFIVALIVLVIIVRKLRCFSWGTETTDSWHRVREAFSRFTRSLDKRTTWSIFGRPPSGLCVVVAIYLTGNVTLCVTPIAWYQLNHFASRAGWLTALNMFLCILLSLKNTPLGRIAKVSHLELNILHRVTGYTTVALVLLHAGLYTWYRGRIGYWSRLIIPANLAGIGACVSMLILGMGIWRHRNYKLFYFSHVGGCIAALGLAYLHRPNYLKKFPFILLFGALIWIMDRFIRAASMSRNALNNHVTLHPLPGDAIRVLLKQPNNKHILPGSHCFLWIPCVNIATNHPFTIVSNGPAGLELVVRPMQGFTRKTFQYACASPGSRVIASIDGPYGSCPEPDDFDKAVLIAGGSGAAYTVGLVNRALDRRPELSLENVCFIWTVRHTVHLSWFYEHLCRFARHGLKIVIYITNEATTSSPDEVVRAALEASRIELQNTVKTRLLSKKNTPSYETITEYTDIEMRLDDASENDDQGLDGSAQFHYKRTKPEDDIAQTMKASDCTDRVLVAACGPTSLMDAVTDSVDSWRDTRNIDVHCESFGE